MTSGVMHQLPFTKKMMLAVAGIAALAVPIAVGLVGGSARAAEGHVKIDGSKMCKPPAYPAEALQAGQTGTVHMSFEVNEQGKVTGTKILQSSGFSSLDKAAVDALALCTYVPARIEGKPATVWAPINFTWSTK